MGRSNAAIRRCWQEWVDSGKFQRHDGSGQSRATADQEDRLIVRSAVTTLVSSLSTIRRPQQEVMVWGAISFEAGSLWSSLEAHLQHMGVSTIRKLIVKLCAMRNEYAKKKRKVPRKAQEFVLLDNMSNRMNQIEKRICLLQHENKEIRESIMDLRIFVKQYKKFEIEFREKIKHMTNEAQMHLDRAVQTYEEREDFISKSDIYKDRCAQDLRKTAINQNSLNLILENTKDFEEFGTLQKQKRSDSRQETSSFIYIHN
ncbi:uncharacterized protein TNCV_629141 [Trichonephila clavipes]|nr:uncharacterized protein TNCV_629141 [Trichonephila clavipes]